MPDSSPTEGPETLHDAATAGDVERLAGLLAADAATVSAPRADGWTPLHLAAHFGHAAAVRVLLAHGADVHAVSTNATANTALHAALAGTGDAATVDLLLAHGADAGARGAGGWTPLHLAASRGNVALVQRLLAAGVDRAAAADDGRDAATIARERGHPDVAVLLER